MGLLDWLFGTKKKKKKKDTNKWAKQAESAKRNTQSNSKKGQRVSSNRPKATTTKPVSSSSRRGSYVSKATQKKAQTNATSIVKANREYTAYRKQAKKDEKAHDKKYGKTLLITPKGRNAKAFHDVNKGKATFAQNTKGNSKAYENVTSFYKQNKGEQDYAKKKVEEAYKHNAFGMGLKDSLRANFFGDDNTAKKVSERIGTKINADLNNEKYQSGKDTGLLLSYLAPGMAQGKIASGIMKGAKAVTKATQGAKAVATVGKSVPKLGKSVKMAGRARKLSAAHKVKKALKGTTKGQHFKAAMIADSMTSTPLNVSAAGAEARRVVDENKEQKKKLKAQSKEASKYLKDSKAAVAQYNKAISDVRNSSLSESEKKKYISNLKEERNKLIQSRRRVSDNKEQLDSQSKSLNTSVNKEFGKNLAMYEGMDRLLGAGIAGFTARGQFKDVFRGKVSKAKVRKIALGENLDKVKKIAKEDIAEQARRRAKVARQEAKTSSQVERNVGKREVTFTDKDGRVLAKGVPRNKEDAQIMLRSARNQAGGIENIRVSSKDLGSPMSRFRSETEKLTEAPKVREPSGWENGKPLTKEDIGKMPDRPIKDSEIEAGSREANRLEEQEKYSRPIDRTESYTKGMESYKNSKVRDEKVKELLPGNHKLNGNTKEISKAIDDDLSEIIARRNAGDMQGAEELENDLARKLAEEDKYIYDKSLDNGEFKAVKEYISSKPFYPPEGMTVKEAREFFGSGNPEAKGVIKFVKRNGKKQGRSIDEHIGEFDDLFPGIAGNRKTEEDFLDAVRDYLNSGYNKDFSLVGELSGKELDEFVDMKRDSIRSAIRDIENDIGAKAEEPVVAKVEEPKPKVKKEKPQVKAEKPQVKAEEPQVAKEKPQVKEETTKPIAEEPEPTTTSDMPPWAEEKPKERPAAIERDIVGTQKKSDTSASVNIRSKLVDQGAGLEDIARGYLKNKDTEKIGKDLMGAINGVRQAQTKAKFHLTNTQRSTGTALDLGLGKSATSITTPIRKMAKKIQKNTGKDAWMDFQEYVFNKHNIDRYKRQKGIFGDSRTAIDSENIIKEIEEKYADNPEFLEMIKTGQKDVVEYFNKLQDIAEAEGLVSSGQRNILDEVYEDYVKTRRHLQEGKQVNMGDLPNRSKTAGTSDVHAATQSNEKLLSIEEQMKIATEETYQRAATNNLIRKLAEAQGGNGDELIKDGITIEELAENSLFTEATSDGKFFMKYFDNGEVQKVPCSHDTFNAIRELNKAGINPANYGKFVNALLTGANISNSLFKKLVTEWNPFFALYRNPMKDIGDALMYSKDFKSFVTHMPQAVKHIITRDKYWQLWKRSGGTSSSFFESTRNLKVSKNPIGMMNQMFEQLPRVTEFSSMIDKQLKAAGHNPGEFEFLTREMIDNASQAGADITVNFGRGGTWVKNLNKYGVPFMNPGVQGLSKAYRTLISERNGAKAWLGLAIKATALGFTPAVVTEVMYANDKEYQMLNARDKANNYLIKKKDGSFIKIPMGRLLADLGAPVRKITSDALGTHGYTMNDVLSLIANNSAPANPFEDNLFMPIIQTKRNETWYGGKIQSDWDTEHYKPENIYDADTTEVSKAIAKSKVGKILDMSPKQLDTLAKRYGGVIAETLMPMNTQRTKGGGWLAGVKNLAKRTFTVNSIYQNKLQNQFYTKNEEATKGADHGTKAEKKRAEQYNNMAQDRLSVINKAIESVENSNLDYKEKNKRLDALTTARNEMLLKFDKTEKVPKDFKYQDMDTVNKYAGANKAIDLYVSDSDKKDTKAYAKNHDLSDIINVEKDITKYGFPATRSRQPKIKALAIEENGVGNKDLYNYFNIDKGTQRTIKAYHAAGGNMKELGGVQKNLEKIVKKVYGEKSGKSVKDLPKGALAYALSLASGKNRVYQMYDESKPMSKDYWKHSVLSGQGMVATGLTAQDRQKAYEATKGASGHPSKDAIMKYLDKKNWTKEQKSYMFWQLANWKTKENPYGDYTPKFKAKKTTSKGSGKPGQVDYSRPASKEFMNNFGANMDKERRRVGEKLYRAAKASKKGINAPYKNDKNYLPKETLQVVRSGDERLDAEALKALKGGGIKALVKQAQKNLPKVKEPEDSDSIFGDGKEGSSGGGGRGYYRRYGRRGYGRGGSGGSGSSGTATKKPEELKTKDAKYNPSTWSPTAVSTDSGWTDAQIRKVYNTLIKQGLTQQQAVARIAQLWHTRFS